MRENYRILVVDDDSSVRSMLWETLNKQGYDVHIEETGKGALAALETDEFDLVITDYQLPDFTGMKVLKTAVRRDPAPGVVMVTGYGSVKHAVKAMREGAHDYLAKPFGADEIEIVLERYFKVFKLRQENRRLRTELNHDVVLDGILGRSPRMQKVFDSIRMIADTNSTVLISGESGTGKELVARAIHNLSGRREHAFIAMNCAAVPETLMESELFGHVKGAFTGADRDKEGKFMAANNGTILLDEISEMELNLQAKLLRVLQEREVEPLGSSKTIPINVRVLATTNRNIRDMVSKGEFREDLYYRLNVVPMDLPPLRERREDIPHLIDFYVRKLSTQTGRKVEKVDAAVYPLLEAYNWPGNVRELINMLERAIVTHNARVLRPEHFSSLPRHRDQRIGPELRLAGMTLEEINRLAILQTLDKYQGNRSRSANALSISVRTLRNKLREYRAQGYLPSEKEETESVDA